MSGKKNAIRTEAYVIQKRIASLPLMLMSIVNQAVPGIVIPIFTPKKHALRSDLIENIAQMHAYLRLIHNFAITNPDLNASQQLELHQTVRNVAVQFERELGIFHAKAIPTLDPIGKANLIAVENECREVFEKLDEFLLNSIAKKSAVIHTRPLFQYDDTGNIKINPKRTKDNRKTWTLEEDEERAQISSKSSSKPSSSNRPKTAGTDRSSEGSQPSIRQRGSVSPDYTGRLIEHYGRGPEKKRPGSAGGGGLSQHALRASEVGAADLASFPPRGTKK